MEREPEYLTLIEQRRLKRKKRRRRRNRILLLILMLGIGIGILFTPLFNLSGVVVAGNERLTSEEIIKTGGFIYGKNIFTVNLKDVGEKISKIPYVETLYIKRRLPDKITVELTECVPMAYVPAAGGYAVIDKTGKALETSENNSLYQLPVLSDFRVEQFTLSEKILTENEEKFKKTLEILLDLYNNSFIDKIKSVSVVEEEIELSISDRLTVRMGSYERFNAKIVMVKEIIANLPEDQAYGVIDAGDPDRVYHDKVMPEGIEGEVPEENGEYIAPQGLENPYTE